MPTKYKTPYQAHKAELKRQQEYRNNNCVQFLVRFIKGADDDVIDKLKSIKNKPEYLRALIRADIEKNG